VIAGAAGGLVAAIACLCAGPGGGPVVASGTSPGGMPWAVHASRDGAKQVTFEFAVAKPGYEDAGYFVSLPYPLPHAFALDATAGSDLDPAGEADVSGVTARRVVRVRISLADGTTLNVRPTLAPAAVSRHRPWLRPVRFFDVFLPDPKVEPTQAVAFDARGRVVGKMKL
jgi:hypothetical protein